MRLCALICIHSGFICHALRVRANDSCCGKGQETKIRHELKTTCRVGEEGEEEAALSDFHLTADSLSSLYEQTVAVCGFCGRNALMHSSACYPPEAQQPLLFRVPPCWSRHSNHLHERIRTSRKVTNTRLRVWNTNRHTTYKHLCHPCDMSECPGAADPLLCSATLFWSGCCIAGAKKGCCHPDSPRLCSHWS